MLLRPSNWSPARIWRMWAECGAFLPGGTTGGNLLGWVLLAGPGGHGEGLRRTCGDAAGAEPGSSFGTGQQ